MDGFNHFYEVKDEIRNLFKECALEILDLNDYPDRFKYDFENFESWLNHDYHAQMKFLEKNLDVRKNPEKILSGARSALVFFIPYFGGKKIRGLNLNVESDFEVEESLKEGIIPQGLVSRYVWSKDYHVIIKNYLDLCIQKIKTILELDFTHRSIVDSVPFLERSAGQKSRLGFIGKNTLLIRPGIGSFAFIGTVLTNIEPRFFAKDSFKSHAITELNCGSCTKCIDACPTQAFIKPYILDSNKCLSYLTIENRGLVSPNYIQHFKNTIYGCDICQNVCPYNQITNFKDFLPVFRNYNKTFYTITVLEIALMSKVQYEKWFGGTAMTRAKYQGLIRNALYHLYATKSEKLNEALEYCKNSNEPLIVETVKQIESILGEN